MDPIFAALPGLSLALLLSLALGRLAPRFGIPRVTVYLLVGLLLGPHALLQWFDASGPAGRWLLGPATAAPLHAIEQLAIGLILFGIGGEFRLQELRRAGPGILALSGGEIFATAALVALAVGAVTGDVRLALIAPALAIASAPSATLVTLREVEAEGPTSRSLILCVGLNNLAALLLFPLALSVAFGTGDALAATGRAGTALAGGAALGLTTAVALEVITGRRELVLLGLLVVLAGLGGTAWLRPGDPGLGMLTCFAAGLALANASPHAPSLFRYLENTVYPLYVLFFIAAGRELAVGALASIGVLGAVFVTARAVGKVGGFRLGLRVARRDEVPDTAGRGLLCQAGIALGLASALGVAAPEATADLRQVVIASVVLFEVAGPWLVRRTVVSAGEVKLANLVPRSEAQGRDILRWVWLELRRNLGLLPREGGGRTSRVEHVMRRRPEVVSEKLPFARLLKVLGESSNELLPVVDEEGRFRGAINYDEVKNALYDPILRDLVIAGDLTEEVADPLSPDDPLATALERMDGHAVHTWPVVHEERLVGLVRRPDVYSLLRRSLRNG